MEREWRGGKSEDLHNARVDCEWHLLLLSVLPVTARVRGGEGGVREGQQRMGRI